MNTPKVLLVLLAASLAVPAVHAQNFTDITLTAQDNNPIALDYMGTGVAKMHVKIGCQAIAQNSAPAAKAFFVHSDEAPQGMTVTQKTVGLSPATVGPACVTGSGFYETNVDVPIAVDASAKGVVSQQLNLTAHFDGIEDGAGEATKMFTVAYHSNYTVVADTNFPVTVKDSVATFHLTVVQNSNARSMVMFESIKESSGKISGLASQPYDTPSKVFNITFKAPPGEWTKAYVNFTTYGHYLLLNQQAGNFTGRKDFSWVFVNGGGAAIDPKTGETKTSPLPMPFLALILAAMLASRKQK